MTIAGVASVDCRKIRLFRAAPRDKMTCGVTLPEPYSQASTPPWPRPDRPLHMYTFSGAWSPCGDGERKREHTPGGGAEECDKVRASSQRQHGRPAMSRLLLLPTSCCADAAIGENKPNYSPGSYYTTVHSSGYKSLPSTLLCSILNPQGQTWRSVSLNHARQSTSPPVIPDLEYRDTRLW